MDRNFIKFENAATQRNVFSHILNRIKCTYVISVDKFWITCCYHLSYFSVIFLRIEQCTLISNHLKCLRSDTSIDFKKKNSIHSDSERLKLSSTYWICVQYVYVRTSVCERSEQEFVLLQFSFSSLTHEPETTAKTIWTKWIFPVRWTPFSHWWTGHSFMVTVMMPFSLLYSMTNETSKLICLLNINGTHCLHISTVYNPNIEPIYYGCMPISFQIRQHHVRQILN